MIPQQLIDAGARIVLIRPLRKGTHVKNWATTGNTSAIDPDLISHLQRGGNYGVLSHNGLCMIDIDYPKAFREAEIKLPASFAVERGNSKRGHYYFRCPDCPDEYRTKTDLGFGDIRLGGNFYVVGPGSIHPSGDKYLVKHNIPLVDIPFAVIKEIIEKHKKLEKKCTVAPSKARSAGGTISDRLNLQCVDIATPDKIRVNDPTNMQGSNPFHGSTTGMNFSINPKKNVWRCYSSSCQSGGGPLELYAVAKGIISCAEAQPGCLDGHWAEVLAELEADGYSVNEDYEVDISDLISESY